MAGVARGRRCPMARVMGRGYRAKCWSGVSHRRRRGDVGLACSRLFLRQDQPRQVHLIGNIPPIREDSTDQKGLTLPDRV